MRGDLRQLTLQPANISSDLPTSAIPEILRLIVRYLPAPESRSMSRLHLYAIQWRVQRA